MTPAHESQVELQAAIPAARCRERLERAAAGEESAPDEILDDMAVAVSGHHFTVENASEDGGWRTFRRLLHAEIVDAPGGALIRGRFQLHRAARVGLAVWFGSMALVVLLLVGAYAADAGQVVFGRWGWAMVAAPGAMLVAAAGLVRWSIAQNRRGETEVIEYVARLLEARHGGPPPS